MTPRTNRQVRLKSRPSDIPQAENFEIEFIDFVHDFGLFFSIIFFAACLFILRTAAKSNFYKLAAVFVLLNLSGHFWNNPLLIIAFVVLTHYVSNCNYKHVSRR